MKKFVGLSILAIIAILGLSIGSALAFSTFSWNNPGKGNSYQVNGKTVTMQVGAGQNIWDSKRGGAPMFTQALPDGDNWSIETAFYMPQRYPAAHVGLVLWNGANDGNVYAVYVGPYDVGQIRVEGSYSGTASGWPHVLRGITGNNGNFETAYTGTTGWLKVTRNSKQYSFFFRPNAQDEWSWLGTISTDDRFTRAGFIGKSWGGTPASVNFVDYTINAGTIVTNTAGRNLTGVWTSDGAGKYYIRQIGSQVWWYGEQSPVSPNWSNVAYGQLDGNTLQLTWADVPKGNIANQGKLILQIVSDNQLKVLEASGGFGDTVLTRTK